MKLLFLLIFLMGCSSVVQQLTTSTNYMMDVPFSVNGKAFVGVGVAPKAESYKIEIKYPYGKISVLTLETCHRNLPIQNDGTKASFLFIPSQFELDDNCALDIGVYNSKSQDAWGRLQFERDDATLSAFVECNGQQISAKGVSLCESKVGTVQRISFSKPVKVKMAPNCKIDALPPIANTWDFEYMVQKGYCYYTFSDDDGNYHEHTIRGWETFIIRN